MSYGIVPVNLTNIGGFKSIRFNPTPSIFSAISGFSSLLSARRARAEWEL